MSRLKPYQPHEQLFLAKRFNYESLEKKLLQEITIVGELLGGMVRSTTQQSIVLVARKPADGPSLPEPRCHDEKKRVMVLVRIELTKGAQDVKGSLNLS